MAGSLVPSTHCYNLDNKIAIVRAAPSLAPPSFPPLVLIWCSCVTELAFMNEIRDILEAERRKHARLDKKKQKLQALQLSRGMVPDSHAPKKSFFILSLDGGGMRGIMNCVLLHRLCEVQLVVLLHVRLLLLLILCARRHARSSRPSSTMSIWWPAVATAA